MTRHIDHLVIAVHDLDGAADFYRRLGFRVGARNHHPWGTDNYIIQFRSSFLELITVADVARIPEHAAHRFSFGAFVRDYLLHREGTAMLVLDSENAVADAALFAKRGIGDYEPFTFERSGRAPDGSETHLAFSLAFAVDPGMPDAGFFTCQQHYPESFWNAELAQHPNGAAGIEAVTLGAGRPADHRTFLEAFSGVHAADGAQRYELGNGGWLDVMPWGATDALVGFRVSVPDLGDMAQRLEEARVPAEVTENGVVIAADDAGGSRIEFGLARSGPPTAEATNQTP